MQIYFHSSLCSYLSRVPILVEGTVCVHTWYNLFAHSSCTSLFILLFIKSTVYCIANLILLHILLLIFSYYFYFIFTYIYIYSLVLCFIFCTVHWADLSWFTFHYWLSCIIEYVTNKRTLNLEPCHRASFRAHITLMLYDVVVLSSTYISAPMTPVAHVWWFRGDWEIKKSVSIFLLRDLNVCWFCSTKQ